MEVCQIGSLNRRKMLWRDDHLDDFLFCPTVDASRLRQRGDRIIRNFAAPAHGRFWHIASPAAPVTWSLSEAKPTWIGAKGKLRRGGGGHFVLDKMSRFPIQNIILLSESRGTLLETIPEAEQERCLGWGS
jgi:hypothetical protein